MAPVSRRPSTDASVPRVAVALAIAVVLVSAFTLWLITIAPRDPARRRTLSVASLSLLAAGVVAFAAAAPVEEGPDEPEWLGVLIFCAIAAMLLAVVPAVAAFFREEGKLAGAALGLSAAFPVLVVAGLISCAIADGCFD
jgi:hypothetical protein